MTCEKGEGEKHVFDFIDDDGKSEERIVLKFFLDSPRVFFQDNNNAGDGERRSIEEGCVRKRMYNA